MFDNFLKFIQSLKGKRYSGLGDKLNYYYTPYFFGALAMAGTFTNYVEDPLDCWTPEYFTSQWIQFVDNVCWMKSTYYLPFNVSVEEGRENGSDREIRYYQWIPIIFASFAALFYAPNFLWDTVISSTINLDVYVEKLTDPENTVDWNKRSELVTAMAESLNHFFENRLNFKSNKRVKGFQKLKLKLAEHPLLFWLFHNNYGSFLAPCYIIIKIIYIFIGIFCMVFLSSFVGPEFYTYGIDIASKFYAKTDWTSISSHVFPKVTLCDIEIRQIGQPKVETVQCVLTINLFNEKIFALVWFWLVFLCFATCFSLLWSIYKISLKSVRARQILFYLRVSENKRQYQDVQLDDPAFQYFVQKYLNSDGVFIIEILETNSNEPFCADLVLEMWHKFLDGGGLPEYEDESLHLVNPVIEDETDNGKEKKSKKNLLCYFSSGRVTKKKDKAAKIDPDFQSVAQIRSQDLKELISTAPTSHLQRISPEDVTGPRNGNRSKSGSKKRSSRSNNGCSESTEKERNLLLERFLQECNNSANVPPYDSGDNELNDDKL